MSTAIKTSCLGALSIQVNTGCISFSQRAPRQLCLNRLSVLFFVRFQLYVVLEARAISASVKFHSDAMIRAERNAHGGRIALTVFRLGEKNREAREHGCISICIDFAYFQLSQGIF